MLNIFPPEIVNDILKYIDLQTFSNIIQTNKKHNEIYYKNKDERWSIIDNIKKPGSPVPLNIETFHNYRYCIDWVTIIYNKMYIPESVIEIFMKQENNDINESIARFDVKLILKQQKLSANFISKYYNLCGWENLILNQDIPLQLLFKIVSENTLSPTQWHNLLVTQKYDLIFIEQNIQNINWFAVSCNKDVITTEILLKYYDFLIWPELTKHGINEEIISIFIDKLDIISWNNIAFYSKLSSNFIIKYRNYLNVQILFRTQQLDYDTILYLIKNQDEFDNHESWINIALYQSLDYNFIKTYKENLSLTYLVRNPRIKRKDLYTLYS